MEGRVLLRCVECDYTTEIVGEIPEEYTRCFDEAVHRDGWVPRPGANDASLICRECLVKKYSGHETVDDEEKVRAKSGTAGS
ncbi:MAG TPA: hypothetical protein VF787_27555 [Thermoanaerobaculia bacterium]